MKEKYEAPVAEKIEFNYEETVVASGESGASMQNKNKCKSLNHNNANHCAG